MVRIVVMVLLLMSLGIELNSVAFGPRANYADRATAASWG
jgi:hypothetical protein